jgi:hypothetical protein
VSTPGYKHHCRLALLAVLCAARAVAAGLEVKPTGLTHPSVAPGQIVTIGWVIANPSDAATTMHERYLLPADWRLAAMDASASNDLTIESKKSSLRFGALMVPSSAPAGDYTIECDWSDATHADVSLAHATITVNVQVRDRLEFSAKQAPIMAIAGESYTVTLVAINRGNSPLQLTASAKASTDWPVTLTPSEFSLAPGTMKAIEARVTTPADLARSAPVSLQGLLTAKTGVTADVTVYTEVYTTKSSENANPAWPATVSTSFISQPGSGSRAQAALEGSARSDDGASLIYLFRSRGVKNGGFFNEPEQYSVAYTGRRVSWELGHQGYELSPLTSRPQFGSGAGFSFKGDERWSGGVFAMNSRESSSVGSQVGVFSRYLASPELTLTVNALGKEEGTRQTFAGERSATTSVEAKYVIGTAMEAKLEVGTSPVRPDAATGDPYAQRLEVKGRPGKTVYAVVAENYGAGYFGSLSNARLLTANVTQSISPTVDLRAEENHRSYANAYAIPGQELVSNREASHLVGATWNPLKSLQLSVDGQRADRSFGFVLTPTRYLETTVRVGARYSFRQFVLSSSVEEGSLEAREGNVRQSAIHRTNSAIDWNPNPRQTFSLFVSTGNDPYSPVAATTRTVGATVHTTITSNLTASLQAGQNLYDAREARRRSYFYSEVAYQLPKHQTIGLRTTWSERTSLTGGGLALALSYTRQLSLPLPSLSRRSSVEGTLTDAKTGEPLRRVVLVLNGRTAVTDRKGHYAFTDLKPGSYQLQVDPRSLGSDRLIREQLPMAVKVNRGETQRIALSAESAGKVYVQLESEKSNAVGASASLPGAGVVVQLVRDSDEAVLSELTDEAGRATFQTVRPGDWKLKVDQAQLPARYRVAKSESPVTVAGSDTQEVKLAVSYEAPAIRWVSSN